jgi:hypothetical protein
MADPQPSDKTGDSPDPATERLRRKLVRFMAINLGVLFVALMAVVIAIVYRVLWAAPDAEPETVAVSEIPSPPPGSQLTGQIDLPEGARLVSHTLSGNRLALDVQIGGEREILIYDIAEGRMIGRFALSGVR